MDISIKVLTPDMADEYITYFDERAFSDGSKEKGCYCVWHHWTQQKELDRSVLPEAERACYKRNYAYELIKADKLHGFAAMCDGQMVGFCNADRKDHYFRLNRENNPESWEGVEADEKVLSIVCYIISPDMRGRGIAKAFLKFACEYAAENGFDFVEGYPAEGDFDVSNCGGPASMYIDCGFEIIRKQGFVIARKRVK
ncbi:MAG: GNAT family N-acetyltransferase [Lachnospiraceae bacterium]|nr:GNAT family N-acetyltransferase [Lachnospiraceae bacterium]